MTWRKMPGVVGKVYQPDFPAAGKKHPCPDCRSCQHCSQERCRICHQEPHFGTGANSRRVCMHHPGKETGK